MNYIRKHNINYLYHMTDIDNLDSILKHGLLSRNDAYEFELSCYAFKL